jgi:hypothetical protein
VRGPPMLRGDSAVQEGTVQFKRGQRIYSADLMRKVEWTLGAAGSGARWATSAIG